MIDIRHFLISLAALAIISGCSSQADTEQSGTPAAIDAPMPTESDGGIGDAAGPPRNAAALASGTIPARFQGVWDYEGGSCDPASDLRSDISGDEIVFYESVGRVKNVAAKGNDVIVTLDMEGEGETWQKKIRLSLVGEGDTQRLHSTDGNAPKQTDRYPGKKCPT